MRKLMKLKYTPKESAVFIRYQVIEHDRVTDVVTHEATEPPLPSLDATLQKGCAHLLRRCEFPAEWESEFTIRSVTVKPELKGLVITGLRGLKNSDTPLVINTPFHEADTAEMSWISALTREACAYADGERAQLELPFKKGA